MMQKSVNPGLILIPVWAAVAAWHPFLVGFFSDDWPLFAAPYPGLYTLNNPRPGFNVLLFLWNSIHSGSTFLCQGGTALLFLAAAYSVYALTAELLRQYEMDAENTRLGATLAAIGYLIAPWGTVFSFWNTLALTLVAQISIVQGLLLLIRNGPLASAKKILHILAGMGFILLGLLIYEAYLPLFLPVLILLWGTQKWTLRDCAQMAVWIGGALIIFALFRLSLVDSFGGKSVSMFPWKLFAFNLKKHAGMGGALKPVPIFLLWGGVTVFVISAVLGGARAVRMVRVAGAATVAGVLGNSLLYAFAGYGITGTGVMSRTLASQSIYFSLFIGMIVPAIQNRNFGRNSRVSSQERHSYLLMALSLLFLFSICAYATVLRSAEWVDLWKRQLAVLESFPQFSLQQELSRTSSKVSTLLVQIDDHSGGEVFGVGYEIGGALLWRYPELQAHTASIRSTFVAREDDWRTTWAAGGPLTQSWCGNDASVIYRLEYADQLIYIHVGKNTQSVQLITDSWEGGCE